MGWAVAGGGGGAPKLKVGDGAGGLAALEAMAAGKRMELVAKDGKLDGEGVRVLRAVLRRPRVAGRLVTLELG